MIGVVIATHNGLAEILLKTAELIVGKMEGITAVSIALDTSPGKITDAIEKAIKSVDSGDGILILNDLFGGSVGNVSLSFLEEGKIDIVAGVNLPLLIKLSTCRSKNNELTLGEMAQMLEEYGKKNIVSAGRLLKK